MLYYINVDINKTVLYILIWVYISRKITIITLN